MTDLAIHLGDVPAHVTVEPFGLGGLTSGFAVYCQGCRSTVAAYLTHIRADPGCVAREVERHANCGTKEAA